MVWKKFRRNVLFAVSRIIPVIAAAALTVLVPAALYGGVCGAEQETKHYFSKQNAAHFWITGTDFRRADIKRVSETEGVTGVQPRMILEAASSSIPNITLDLYAVPDDISINIPYITEGGGLKTGRDVLLSDVFAKANGLSTGDFYEVKLASTGNILKLYIRGLVKSPECMYHIGGKHFTPNQASYGFGYISEDAMSQITGRNSYNQLCLTVQKDADSDKIKRELSETLGAKAVNILALEDNVNAYALFKQSGKIKTAAFIFSLLFFAAAAWVLFFAVRRFAESMQQSAVDSRRGKDRNHCVLLYAAFAVLPGCVIGTLAGGALIKPAVSVLFGDVDFPPLENLHNSGLLASILTAGFFICTGVAFAAVKQARFRPEKRAKARRTAVCTAVCAALILAAGACSFELIYNNRKQNSLYDYDLSVTLNDTVTEAQYQHLEALPNVEAAQFEMVMGAKLYSEFYSETVLFKVTENRQKLAGSGGRELASFPADGVVLSEDTANALHVSSGDEIRVKLTGDNQYYRMRVAEVTRGINGAYVLRNGWQSLGQPFRPNTAYLKTSNLESVRESVQQLDFAAGSEDKAYSRYSRESLVTAAFLAAGLLIFLSGILALAALIKKRVGKK